MVDIKENYKLDLGVKGLNSHFRHLKCMKNIIKNRHADDIMLVINVTSSGLDQNKVHIKVTISQ